MFLSLFPICCLIYSLGPRGRAFVFPKEPGLLYSMAGVSFLGQCAAFFLLRAGFLILRIHIFFPVAWPLRSVIAVRCYEITPLCTSARVQGAKRTKTRICLQRWLAIPGQQSAAMLHSLAAVHTFCPKVGWPAHQTPGFPPDIIRAAGSVW